MAAGPSFFFLALSFFFGGFVGFGVWVGGLGASGWLVCGWEWAGGK